MATLVTGGVGFAGSNIVRALAQSGHEVVSLDVAPVDALAKRYLEPWKGRVRWLEGDILDRKGLDELASKHKFDKVVHAAAFTGSRPETEKLNGQRILDINITGTVNIVEMARKAGVRRFLYVGTAGVYTGPRSHKDVLKEDVKLFPDSFYGISKLASEMIVGKYGQVHGFETVGVRMTSLYGPMERVSGHRSNLSLPTQWTRAAIRGEAVDMSLTSQDRDFIYAPDAAKAIQTVLDAPASKHKHGAYSVYNVGRGLRVSSDEMLEAMKKAWPKVTFTGAKPAPEEDLRRALVDTGRLRELGYTPEHSIVQGLTAYMKWRTEFSYKD
ncbi:MAG: NAD(P)-dependent oxidoreductase [SAR202 cluster bacterium]|nr:NAD(P)-dependent oxidoreductase [SAR202 cluster bacterium]